MGLALARDLNERDTDFVAALIANPESKKRFTTLGSILTREYWMRIWVIQEAALAASIIVYCGADSISWACLDSVRTILRIYGELLVLWGDK
jgi:hypothetical protein